MYLLSGTGFCICCALSGTDAGHDTTRKKHVKDFLMACEVREHRRRSILLLFMLAMLLSVLTLLQ